VSKVSQASDPPNSTGTLHISVLIHKYEKIIKNQQIFEETSSAGGKKKGRL
jgi:hypothetical protein